MTDMVQRSTAVGAAAPGFFATLADKFRRYTLYRNTLRELDALSDRDLLDLGLSRSAIEGVAHEAAYGK